MPIVTDDTTRDIDAGVTAKPRPELILKGVLPGDSNCIRLRRAPLILGRSPDCDVRLEFGEVSRRHAALVYEGSTLVLRDLSSTNGTYIDGRRTNCCALREGSLVRIGAWLGIVEALSEAESDAQCIELAPGLLGGPRVALALASLRAVAQSSLPVVITGDTGSGKERFAAALHHFSRRTGPLHAVNCASLPASLAESELFGHERGAFTGAELKTRGHFRAADRGTLFLDELQELPLGLQAKVLRAIELGEVTPLGDSRSIAYDARIVVASQRPLAELVATGVLRPDLAMRLNGLIVAVPSLAQRRSDIPSLFAHFLRENGSGIVPSVAPKFYERLCLYGWPGNVRELELLARRMLALHGHSPLSIEQLPEELASATDLRDASGVAFESRDAEDRHLLSAALEKTRGNMKRAAQIANLSRARAYRLLGKPLAADENARE